MIFLAEPAGLALLAAVPLVAWLLARGVRRRRVVTSAFPLLRERLLALPVLSGGHLRRRRVQAALFLAGTALLALAAGGPTLGSRSAAPVKVLLVLDHLAGGAAPGGGAGSGGWPAVLDTARAVVGRLRSDDRVFLVRTDTGSVPGGGLPPRAAARALQGLEASELPPAPGRVADLLGVLAQAHLPDAVVLVTPDPTRWRGLRTVRGLPLTVLRSGPPGGGGNLGLVAVEVRPDLMNPRKVDLFCRVGFYDAAAGGKPVEATVEVRGKGALLGRRTLRLAPGESGGMTFPGLLPEAGVLEVALTPADAFPGDNLFRAAVRDSPFLTAALISPGNPALESALRALPGLEVATHGSAAEIAGSPPAVAVFDNAAPGGSRSNLLLVRPPGSGADLIVRGEVLRPGAIEAEAGEPVLEGVSFAGLTVPRLPVYLPPPSYRVVARAGGYPLVMLGKNALGRRVAVIGFDPVESGWRHDPSFPVLVANLVSWLGEEAPVETVANLVDEEVSRAMALSPLEPGDQLPAALAGRPFRFAAQALLLALALALLLAELAVAPPRVHGRLPR